MTQLRLVIDGRPFSILADGDIRGRRAYERRSRAGEPGDPTRPQVAHWALHGAMGRSRETPDGALGVDESECDHRWPYLLQPPPAATAVALNGSDPAQAQSFKLGDPLGSGSVRRLGVAPTAADVSHLTYDRGYIYAARGRLLTELDPADWTVKSTTTFDSSVRDVANWRGKGFAALGSGEPMRRRVSTNPGTYEQVTATSPAGSVAANALAPGSDVLFIAKATDGDTDNPVVFTADDVATLSAEFQMGDGTTKLTGLGRLGPFTFAGTESGLFSFTKRGEPVAFLRELEAILSETNGSRMAEAFGWLYVISEMGLWAVRPDGARGRVGPESVVGFEGTLAGYVPKAVAAVRDELLVSYSDGTDSWVLRGSFGPFTDATGLPEWHNFIRREGSRCGAVYGTGEPSGFTYLLGANDDAIRIAGTRNGKDLADATLTYGGADTYHHWGTRMERAPGLLKYLRQVRVRVENVSRTETVQLAASFDERAYVDIGPAIIADGFHRLRPTGGGALPLESAQFFTFKPRVAITMTAASATPPRLRGVLEVHYDERPEYVEEVGVALKLGAPGRSAADDRAFLDARLGSAHPVPVVVQLPDDYEARERPAFLTAVASQDSSSGASGVAVQLVAWPYE